MSTRPSAGASPRRGSDGPAWWSRRMVDVIERLADPGRLVRGRSYARSGRVLTFQIVDGKVRGEVQGSQIDPFSAMIEFRPLDQYERASLVEEVGRTPGMLSVLAAGRVPAALADLLLPAENRDVEFDCTCLDFGWPCRHAAALVFLTAERLDAQPVSLFTLRGITLEEVIEQVALRGEATESGDAEASGDAVASGDAEAPGDGPVVLPPLPQPSPRAAPADLDATRLRAVLGRLGGDVRAAERALDELYRRMTDGP